MFNEVRAAIALAFAASADPSARAVGRELSAEINGIENYLSGDSERVSRLFEALERRDEAGRGGAA